MHTVVLPPPRTSRILKWSASGATAVSSMSGENKMPDEVLIVEDDPELRETLAEILTDEGCRFSIAADGLEAIRYLKGGSRPSVILLDLSMPVVNGWEFRLHQKRTPEISDIPIVLITAGVYDRDELAFVEPADLLHKPIDLDRLLETIRKYCGPAVTEPLPAPGNGS